MTVIKNITLLVFTAMLGVFVLGGTSFYLTSEINSSASFASVNTVPSLLDIDRAAEAFASLHALQWEHLNEPGKSTVAPYSDAVTQHFSVIGKALEH